EPVGDAVELVADVLDGAAGRMKAQELAGVSAAEPQPDGDLVLGSEDVFDVRLQVGERVLHHLEALPPHLSPVLRFGQLSQVDDEVRGHMFHALVSVAGVEAWNPARTSSTFAAGDVISEVMAVSHLS